MFGELRRLALRARESRISTHFEIRIVGVAKMFSDGSLCQRTSMSTSIP